MSARGSGGYRSRRGPTLRRLECTTVSGQAPLIEAHFGESAPLTIGVEEELWILDAETLELSPSVRTLLAGVGERSLPGRLKTELFAAAVELTTGICSSPEDAVTALRSLRRAARELAEAHGLVIAASGSHPISRPEEQEIVSEQRYLQFVDYAGVSARRQGVSGLHIHVGMPSGDACLHVLERVLPWLPLVLALSANSPYLSGEQSGMLSIRAEILALLPRRGAPPAFRTYAEWERFVERMVGTALAPSHTAFWWDIRPHPAFGTLEVRMPDQPTSLERTAALITLVQRLCGWALEQEPRIGDAAGRGLYDQNRWAAARFGPRAELVHPERFEAVQAGELFTELRQLVGFDGDLDAAACEADRQLAVGRADGLRAVCADLVERSLA